MTTTYDLPMPGETRAGGVIVASCWATDDLALLLLLREAKPYYRVVEMTWRGGGWIVDDDETFENINEAVAYYAQNGGDI
jgi:hypothetical protein